MSKDLKWQLITALIILTCMAIGIYGVRIFQEREREVRRLMTENTYLKTEIDTEIMTLQAKSL